MPRSSLYALRWSEEHQQYELHLRGQLHLRFPPGESEAFSRWLSEQTSFAFVGQAGWLSVIKEARAAGAGYWYAYRTQDRHTRKRYLGPTAKVTFARLEEAAARLTPTTNASNEQARSTAGQQQKTFLSIKLVPPHLPNVLVDRPRLLRDLDAIYTCPLTLVSASAGSGKTTLLATWITGSSQRLARIGQTDGSEGDKRDRAVAWLSLDEMDNDPLRFWGSCIAALQTCRPSIGHEAFALLHTPQAPPLSTILTMLLNELREERQELILILDDYHVIEHQTIAASMLFFLDHLPRNLHLVCATRADPELPLARWRMRGQLIEIRDCDLRFSREEAASFLRRSIGHTLSEEEIVILQVHTEGWVAGLQLAALSLSRREDVSAFVKDFGGSHRFVLDYVQQDILARLPVALQHFLLQTSILTRMNAAACQAVMAGPDLASSQHMLEEVDRANLFVVPLDEHRHWYRYHDLFRETLLACLQARQPELVPLLHQRAACWYKAARELREAIAHALAAPDYPLAASLMEQAAESFWRQGEGRTVYTWIFSLPDIVLRAHLRLALSAALRLVSAVNLSNETLYVSLQAEMEHCFARIAEMIRHQRELQLSEAEVTFIQRRLSLLQTLIEARIVVKRGDTERMRSLASEIETLPRDEEDIWNMIPLTLAFWLTEMLQGETASLIPRLLVAKPTLMEAEDPQVTIRFLCFLAHSYIRTGHIEQAEGVALSALALVKETSLRTPIEGYLFYAFFLISYNRNRLEEADGWLRRLQICAQDWQQVELLVMEKIYAVRLRLIRGNLGAVHQMLDQLESLIEQEGFASHARGADMLRVQLWLAEGNLAKASEWAAHITFPSGTWNSLRRWEVLMLVRVLLAQHKYTQAIEVLERFRQYLDRPGVVDTTLEWTTLYVVALHQGGLFQEASVVLARLLAITEPEGLIRMYLDAGDPMKQALLTWQKVLYPTIDIARQKKERAALVAVPPAQAELPSARSFVSGVISAFEQAEEAARRMPGQESQAAGVALAQGHSSEGERLAMPLSRQEMKVLHLLAAGYTYTEMAKVLVVSPNTIKSQVGNIYRKLNVRSRLEAYAAAQRLRLL